MTESTQKYVRYIENCDNEGEKWSVFIKVPETDTEKELLSTLDMLSLLISDDYEVEKEEDDTFTLYTQHEVDLLIRENFFSSCNYMSAYNHGVIRDSILNLKDETDPDEIEEQFYKMSVVRFD